MGCLMTVYQLQWLCGVERYEGWLCIMNWKNKLQEPPPPAFSCNVWGTLREAPERFRNSNQSSQTRYCCFRVHECWDTKMCVNVKLRLLGVKIAILCHKTPAKTEETDEWPLNNHLTQACIRICYYKRTNVKPYGTTFVRFITSVGWSCPYA
jgi:hypothetical protein